MKIGAKFAYKIDRAGKLIHDARCTLSHVKYKAVRCAYMEEYQTESLNTRTP